MDFQLIAAILVFPLSLGSMFLFYKIGKLMGIEEGYVEGFLDGEELGNQDGYEDALEDTNETPWVEVLGEDPPIE